MSRQSRDGWRAYQIARRLPFWSAEPNARPSLIERAWIKVFG